VVKPAFTTADIPIMTQAITDQTAQVSTWDEVWKRSDSLQSHRRLNAERRGRRWRELCQALDRWAPDSPLRTVELGAGEGDLSILLAERGHDVTLVDFCDKALARARHRFDSLGLEGRFVQADLFEFARLHTAEFDLSVSLGTAEHFSGEQRSRIIEAHHDVVRRGGFSFISVPNAHCLPYRFWMSLMKLRGWWRYGYEEPFTYSELRHLSTDAGLRVRKLYATQFAQCIDSCLLQLAIGSRLGWIDGPKFVNALQGWNINLIAQAA
jgi:2-polyprenyl-3-methyl-5-hydroxy-6-metoxy-1,4-benzoquinol methylase